MEEIHNNNKVIDSSEAPQEFKYNFFNTPWGDRSDKSKIGIVGLLIGIFITIMGLVINGLILNRGGTKSTTYYAMLSDELNCHLTKMEKHRYVARIHSVETQELLCVGAVISPTSVLANHVCVRSGPVRLHLGGLSDPRCRKGFSVKLLERIRHDGVIGGHLALMTSHESITDCSEVIPIGSSIDVDSHAYIIGRPNYSKNSLSRRPVVLSPNGTCNFGLEHRKGVHSNSTICVDDYGRCPVQAGDLLVQDGHLYGLASTSLQHTEAKKLAAFANLSIAAKELLETDGFL